MVCHRFTEPGYSYVTSRLLEDKIAHNVQLAAHLGRRVGWSHVDEARTGLPGEDRPEPADSSEATQPMLGSGSREGTPPSEAMPAGGVGGKLSGVSRCLTPELCPEKVHTRPHTAQTSRKYEPDPAYLRDALVSYYRILDVAEECRAEATAAGADLQTRIAWASVIDDMNGWIASCESRLSAIARRGGRGVSAPGVAS